MRMRKMVYGMLAGLAVAIAAVNFMDLFDPIAYTDSVLNLVYRDDSEYRKNRRLRSSQKNMPQS